MAALDAASLDDSASGASSHAGAEAVLALAAAYIGLISAFHNRKSRSGEFAAGIGYEHPGEIVKGISPKSVSARLYRTSRSRKVGYVRERKNSRKLLQSDAPCATLRPRSATLYSLSRSRYPMWRLLTKAVPNQRFAPVCNGLRPAHILARQVDVSAGRLPWDFLGVGALT